MNHPYDAVVVGSGPNGLSAAISLAQSGRSVRVIEGKDHPGGGTRSGELTLPGYVHDICSAIYPLGAASPFFSKLPLDRFGLHWVFSPVEVAHPLDDGTAVLFWRSIDKTAQNMGQDAAAYRLVMGPHLANWKFLIDQFLGPIRFPTRPLAFAWLGVQALLPASTLLRIAFRGERARAAMAGMGAHSMMPLDWAATGGFSLVMALLAHSVGYPLAMGGANRISDALVAYLRSLGGEIETGRFIHRFDELPEHRTAVLDVTPRQLVDIAGDRLPAWYLKQLNRFRYGVGVFKIDYALDGPVPWRAKEVGQAATVHIGGTLEEIEASESAAWRGEISEKPFVLVAQQSLFDPTRAPEGKQTLWAYCHVPNGSSADMTRQIEAQIERFAPGFQNRILARSTCNAVDMQAYNPNYIGGDINGGVQDLLQFFTRPTARLVPYSTPARNIYLCSSSTPPGGGVHGMCGYYAAKAVTSREKL
jgi:phytoene dehydrogenase-like protein